VSIGLVLDGTSVPELIPALKWVFTAQTSVALTAALLAALLIRRRSIGHSTCNGVQASRTMS
jgi:hypothetical protein